MEGVISLDERQVSTKKHRVTTLLKQDFLVIRYASRATDSIFVDNGIVEGVIESLYLYHFVVICDKGYRRSISYRDITCGHATVMQHTRGGNCVDQAFSNTSATDGADRREKHKTSACAEDDKGHS